MQKSNKKTITKPVGALSVRNNHEKDPIAPSKNHRGITLIALIITIIVMIILVGVTVNVALNGGLFDAAQKAAEDTEYQADYETLQAGVVGAMASEEGITQQTLTDNLPTGWNVGETEPYTVTSPNGNVFTVKTDGTIETNNSEEPEEPEVEKIISADDPEAKYWKTDGNGTILYYDVPEGVEVPETLVVPSQIGNEKITKIGDFALLGLRIQRNEDGSAILQSEDDPLSIIPIDQDMPTGATTKVKNIIISKGIEETGNFSIGYNFTIETVEIPSTMRTLGENFISSDSALKTVKIKEGLEIIGDGAFSGCEQLTNIELPNSLKTIGWNVFSDCTALEEILIPESVDTIKSYAFSGCTSIQEITIPESVDTMGHDVFANWTAEQTIYMGKSEEPPLVSDSTYTKPGWNYLWKHGCNANVIWSS